MNPYDFKRIEKKWQEIWEKKGIFAADDKSKKSKAYVLDMFPYPSGAGLHVGHPRGYIGTDVIARFMKMKGYNVLHPMGWDAFGLPAENYAIKTGIHPEISTKENIQRFKKQMNLIGLSYDWSREVNTSDPEYYKWTQWIFLLLFKKGLAYQAVLPINWCPSCKTGLANEEVVNGKCERCGTEVTKKNIRQWVLKITAYSQQLLDGLENLDWPEKIKEMQRNWIGKSEGADIDFQVKDSDVKIKVFTTRPDTIFGATFLVLAPEHPLLSQIVSKEKLEEVRQYQEETKKKLDVDRQLEDKEKTGVFIGSYAINPASGKEIPIYVADYVLPYYGYGAIMAVPAHDQRDMEFAKKYGLETIQVIQSGKELKEAYIGEGSLMNSKEFDNLDSLKAQKEIVSWLKKKKLGDFAVNYKLRDWVFSRQRYWGEPIPLVFCPNCKEKIESKKYKKNEFNIGEILNPGWIALEEKDLPLTLPEIDKFQPTGTGESPLAEVSYWVNTKCPKCGGEAKRETNTMPQWAGSCWYFIRYADPNNKEEIIDRKKAKKWLPVDFYIGGAEHAVLHLLYSRFWIKALKEEKVISFDEPFLKLRTIGLILAPDGQKMSKSRGNVINPDDIIKEYGADAFRIYEMFMGPFDQPISWDTKSIMGAKRFLDKVYAVSCSIADVSSKKTEKLLHKTIKKVTEDIQEQKFNTAIASMMEFINNIDQICFDDFRRFLKLLSVFAPHISEELYKPESSIFNESWPEYDKKLIIDEKIEIAVQVNGKLRDTILVNLDSDEEEVKNLALQSERIQKYLEGREIKKTIFVKNKLINLVI
ncbi:MAG: leucine--tRNA ligase [Candidatus Pacebacteria bacterium]|nr:leucine--tRNA ligase [Candidatus Paceibacterota bacterium]